ncbi:MAG: SURF1 family protein [Burkholderiales bacterium]
MQIGRFQFSPSLLPTLAAIAAIALTASLGRWQLNRAAEKQALQTEYEVKAKQPAEDYGNKNNSIESIRYKNIVVRGEFDRQAEIFLDNKFHLDKPGYHVITPLRMADNRYILVNRGWVARETDYRNSPTVKIPQGSVTIEGVAVPPSGKFLELSTQTVEGKVWQNLVLSRYIEQTKLSVEPLVIQQQNDTGDGLQRVVERPDVGIAKHQGYAFQWFALSIGIFITYIATNTKRIKPS